MILGEIPLNLCTKALHLLLTEWAESACGLDLFVLTYVFCVCMC